MLLRARILRRVKAILWKRLWYLGGDGLRVHLRYLVEMLLRWRILRRGNAPLQEPKPAPLR